MAVCMLRPVTEMIEGALQKTTTVSSACRRFGETYSTQSAKALARCSSTANVHDVTKCLGLVVWRETYR